MSADDVLPRRPARDVELRHGYTLYQVNALSIWAVQRDTWHSFVSFDQRLEVMWHAMIEHIYASAEPPQVNAVIQAGWHAIRHDFSKDKQFRGTHTRDREAVANAGFERYWHSFGQPVISPEEQVTECLALAQIWSRLRADHRELITALAEHEDYGRAAAAMGKPRHNYATDLGKARKAFRKLWHEGETPSRPWGADRRAVKSDSPKAAVTYRLAVRRRAAVTRNSTRHANEKS